jgi:hypothetical protein
MPNHKIPTNWLGVESVDQKLAKLSKRFDEAAIGAPPDLTGYVTKAVHDKALADLAQVYVTTSKHNLSKPIAQFIFNPTITTGAELGYGLKSWRKLENGVAEFTLNVPTTSYAVNVTNIWPTGGNLNLMVGHTSVLWHSTTKFSVISYGIRRDGLVPYDPHKLSIQVF